MKYRRWGKKEDRRVFYDLYLTLEKSKVSIDDFVQTCNVSDELDNIFKRIMCKHNWKGEKLAFYKRIRKAYKTAKNFSVRETKMIRQVARSQMKADKYVDYNKMVYYFPGANAEMLRSFHDSINPKLKIVEEVPSQS